MFVGETSALLKIKHHFQPKAIRKSLNIFETVKKTIFSCGIEWKQSSMQK